MVLHYAVGHYILKCFFKTLTLKLVPLVHAGTHTHA